MKKKKYFTIIRLRTEKNESDTILHCKQTQGRDSQVYENYYILRISRNLIVNVRRKHFRTKLVAQSLSKKIDLFKPVLKRVENNE